MKLLTSGGGGDISKLAGREPAPETVEKLSHEVEDGANEATCEEERGNAR
jgi:hypothetical protein